MTKANPARAILLALSIVMTAGGCYWLFPNRGVPEGLAGYPGQDPAATRAYVASLDFSVQDSIFSGPLECETPASCGNSATVNIRIVPERRAFKAPVENALRDAEGHIVARIENLENKPFHPYGLGPSETAYLWVGAMRSGERRMAIYRIDRESGQATALTVAAQAGWCPDADEDRKIAAVHINENPMCTERSFYSQPARSASAGRLADASAGHEMALGALASAFSHARGLWFSCSMGCCEARGFEPALQQ